MFSRHPFFSAIAISLVIHIIIFLQLPEFRFTGRRPDNVQVEIKYVESRKEANKPSSAGRKTPAVKLRHEPLLKLPTIVTAATSPATSAPLVNRQEVFDKKKQPSGKPERIFTKPTLSRPGAGILKKKITLVSPLENINKSSSPSYIGYFQLTREKVRRILYQRYSYTEEGEVYVYFILTSDGNIKDIRVDEERSSPSEYLREIAVASVKDAAPFPIFPKDLEYPELSFNVVISFEVE